MWLFSSLFFPVESPVELSKFGSGKVGLGLPKTPRVAPVGDSAVLIVPFVFYVSGGGFPGKKMAGLFEAKMSQSVQQQSGWFIHVGLSRSNISKIRWVNMVLPEMLPSTLLQKDPKTHLFHYKHRSSLWFFSHSLPIPYNVFFKTFEKIPLI